MANEKIVECEVVRNRLGMMTQLGGSGKVTAHERALESWAANIAMPGMSKSSRVRHCFTYTEPLSKID
jgi:hypothetical protein